MMVGDIQAYLLTWNRIIYLGDVAGSIRFFIVDKLRIAFLSNALGEFRVEPCYNSSYKLVENHPH